LFKYEFAKVEKLFQLVDWVIRSLGKIVKNAFLSRNSTLLNTKKIVISYIFKIGMQPHFLFQGVICPTFRGGFLGVSWGLRGGFLGVRRGKSLWTPRKPLIKSLRFLFMYKTGVWNVE